MAKDKYTAVWTSHSSIGDFLKCPRAYYLKNMYKDPKTGRKIALVNPALSLGQIVHEVIERLSKLPVDKRFDESLIDKLETAWKKVSGKKGGFSNEETEIKYKERGKEMLKRVIKNPGPLKNLAVKIKMELPYFWLSEEDNIILCGKIDWLEYLKDDDKVHIIDFKTGRKAEKPESLQLDIYHLLVAHCQERKVGKASYWYLENSDEPIEQKLGDLDEAFDKILKIGKKMKLARQLGRFKCADNGCWACKPMEMIISGDAELVGIGGFGNKTDVYILNQPDVNVGKSEIL